jgi:hypothetical protein
VGLKYTKGFLNKKSKADLLELEPDLFDEDVATTMTVGEIRAELALVEEADDELEDDELEDELEEDDEELPEEDEVDEAPPAAKPKAKAKQTKYTEGGKNGEGAKLLGAKEVAAEVGTDAKTLRQFFRSGKSTFTAVGAGGRYEFAETDVPKIKAEFEAWKAGKPGRGRGASEGGSKRRGRAPKAEEVIDEVEEIEELEDLEELDEDDLELEE